MLFPREERGMSEKATLLPPYARGVQLVYQSPVLHRRVRNQSAPISLVSNTTFGINTKHTHSIPKLITYVPYVWMHIHMDSGLSFLAVFITNI